MALNPREDLTNILIDVLQVNQVIFIPVEPGDDTGHSDGMVRFVDEQTVVANDYSGIEVSRKFKDRGLRQLDDLSRYRMSTKQRITTCIISTQCIAGLVVIKMVLTKHQ